MSTRAASVLADERAPSSASASDETSATSESATKRNTARPARPRRLARHGPNIVPPPGPARVPCPDRTQLNFTVFPVLCMTKIAVVFCASLKINHK